MSFIARHIKWIMLVSGVLTCSMIFAAIAPQAALMNTFGATIPTSPVAEIVVRNWGALITLIGIMLIYGAFRPLYRPFVLVIAVVSKVIFIGLILSIGSQYLDKAGIAVAFDSIVIALFILYLFSAESRQANE